MAKPGQDTKSAQGGLSELKRRLLFVLGAIIIYRLGSFVLCRISRLRLLRNY